MTSRESLYELFPKGQQLSKAQRETVIKNPELEFSENPEVPTPLILLNNDKLVEDNPFKGI